MINTELSLSRNANVQQSDSAWTFGQILAMLLLAPTIPNLAETILARQEGRRRTKLLKNTLASGIRADLMRVCDLVKRGGNVNVIARGIPTAALEITSALTFKFQCNTPMTM